jgi:hypothetical protein
MDNVDPFLTKQPGKAKHGRKIKAPAPGHDVQVFPMLVKAGGERDIIRKGTDNRPDTRPIEGSKHFDDLTLSTTILEAADDQANGYTSVG